MRPVNLIPQEDRRESGGALRSGPLAYLILGALALVLAGVALLVITENQISDRTTELAELQRETAASEAKVTELAPYVQFNSIRTQRTLTVSNLANSRFDWDRVMQELALVLPDDVSLINLTGTVRPNVSVGGGGENVLRSAIAGPALSMAGCAPGQDAVAGFITVLKDIDGVTRVGLQSSQLPTGGTGAESVSAGGDCSSTEFQLVVAFDAAPVASPATGVTEVAAPEAEAPPAEEGAAAEEGE